MQQETIPTNIKLYVLSDIHLEFYKTLPKLEKKIQDIDLSCVNILCLCGDIGYPHSKIYKWFITWCSEHFTKVFIITGNHEYYSDKYTISEIDSHIGYLTQKYENVTFLNNTTELYEGILFAGTTLWSDLTALRTEKTRWYDFNDFNEIYYTDEERLTTATYQELHNKSVAWLLATLKQTAPEQPIIVLTHHLPTYRAIHPSYGDSPYNFLFASHLDNIFKEHSNISCWFAGHTHKDVDMYINNTRLVINPIGYLRENPHVQRWNKCITWDIIRNIMRDIIREEIKKTDEFDGVAVKDSEEEIEFI